MRIKGKCMQQKIAILDDSMINTLLEQQQKILQLLQGKNMSIESSAYCNVREAAQILCVSEQKVRQMIDNNELKYKKLGRTIRIYRSTLV